MRRLQAAPAARELSGGIVAWETWGSLAIRARANALWRWVTSAAPHAAVYVVAGTMGGRWLGCFLD